MKGGRYNFSIMKQLIHNEHKQQIRSNLYNGDYIQKCQWCSRVNSLTRIYGSHITLNILDTLSTKKKQKKTINGDCRKTHVTQVTPWAYATPCDVPRDPVSGNPWLKAFVISIYSKMSARVCYFLFFSDFLFFIFFSLPSFSWQWNLFPLLCAHSLKILVLKVPKNGLFVIITLELGRMRAWGSGTLTIRSQSLQMCNLSQNLYWRLLAACVFLLGVHCKSCVTWWLTMFNRQWGAGVVSFM